MAERGGGGGGKDTSQESQTAREHAKLDGESARC